MAKKEIIKVNYDPERVKIAMAFRQMNRNDLAEKSGVSKTSLQRAEKNGWINQEFMDKIVLAIGFPEQFLSGGEVPNRVIAAFNHVIAWLGEFR